MSLTIVRFADADIQPWRNGGGVTHELWRVPASGDFKLRMSIATVAGDGPFSMFPGVDRVLILLEGHGFDLVGTAGRRTVTLSSPCLKFSGDEVWACSLIDGPVRDFNVMVRRGLQVRVSRIGPGMLAHGECFVLALVDGVVVGRDTLNRYDLARVAARGGAAHVEAPEGGALLVSTAPVAAR
ncbi:MAG: hypothetical protein EXR71_12765 [Myxococcales bacterium]|nr:hypothetical protein [Myxococcales bacterium]